MRSRNFPTEETPRDIDHPWSRRDITTYDSSSRKICPIFHPDRICGQLKRKQRQFSLPILFSKYQII
jgi:hypothetical protein